MPIPPLLLKERDTKKSQREINPLRVPNGVKGDRVTEQNSKGGEVENANL